MISPPTAKHSGLPRQVTGKLDLTIAAVDEQVEALGKVMLSDYAARRGGQHHHPLGRLQHHDGRADRQPVTVAGRRPPGRQRQARRRRAGGTYGGDRSRHRAHPRAHQRRAAKQRVPCLRARAVDARSLGKPGAGAHRRHDRDGTQRDGQLRVARSRDGDGNPPVRAHRADPQARRSRNADPLPHCRKRNLRQRC